MKELHKELLAELVKDWDLSQLEQYLDGLHERAVEMDEWIRAVKELRRKRVRKAPMDTGVRGG